MATLDVASKILPKPTLIPKLVDDVPDDTLIPEKTTDPFVHHITLKEDRDVAYE